MEDQKGSIRIALVAIIVIIVAALLYVVVDKNNPEEIVCTQDAMICPDGSAVSRTGPNCEFAPCPEPQDETAGWKTYSNTQYGFEMKYPSEWKIVYSGDKFVEFESTETVEVAVPNTRDMEKYFYKVGIVIDNPGWQYGKPADSEKTLSIAGEQASQYKLKGDTSIGCWSGECIQTNFVKDRKQYSIIFDGGTRSYIDGKLFSIYGSGPVRNELEKYQIIYYQILSTFKFTK